MPCSPQSRPPYLRVSATTSSVISRISFSCAGILHVDGRAYVQHAGIDVAEHAVDEAAAVEHGAELGDEVGEVLGRHGGVLDEGDRPLVALHVAEQADRLLAHVPDARHVGLAARHREAAPAADPPPLPAPL